MDIEEDARETCKKVIEGFLSENNIDLNELKKDMKKLRKLIILLRNQYNISLRKIAEEVNINREKVRQIYRGSKA